MGLAARVVGAVAAATVVGVIALPILGFRAAGIASGPLDSVLQFYLIGDQSTETRFSCTGTIAAKMMTSAAIANGGGVGSGTLVAILQSFGATYGTFTCLRSNPSISHRLN